MFGEGEEKLRRKLFDLLQVCISLEMLNRPVLDIFSWYSIVLGSHFYHLKMFLLVFFLTLIVMFDPFFGGLRM